MSKLPEWIEDLDISVVITIAVLAVIFLAELLFYIYISCIMSPLLQPIREPQKPLFGDPAESIRYVYSLIESLDSYSAKRWISGLFLFTSFEDIHREDFISALAWAVYVQEVTALTREQRGVLIELQEEAFRRFNISMPEGSNPNVRHVKFNLEPVSYIHKPLFLYGLLNFLEIYYLLLLHSSGFGRYSLPDGTSYWFRPHPKGGTFTFLYPLFLFH